MENIKTFKTLWGNTHSLEALGEIAARNGFDGIEGPIPQSSSNEKVLAKTIAENGLLYIAEVATTGTFVPNRKLTPDDHICDLSKQLERIRHLEPMFVTCLGGCDNWETHQSVDFFGQAVEIAAKFDLEISFETHRGRSLFTPWITKKIVDLFPSIKLTFDVSHWDVVCEGLQDSDIKIIREIAKNAYHIHARVGYDQGPQVPDPSKGIYREQTKKYFEIWKVLIDSQVSRGFYRQTITPEFGPDGYEYRNMEGDASLVTIDKLNRFINQALKKTFNPVA